MIPKSDQQAIAFAAMNSAASMIPRIKIVVLFVLGFFLYNYLLLLFSLNQQLASLGLDFFSFSSIAKLKSKNSKFWF
jgi:hypothetical protein